MAVAMVLKVLLIFSYLVYRFAIGVQKAPETCGYSIDMRGTVPGIYESLSQRVAAWRRGGMQKNGFFGKEAIAGSKNPLAILAD